MWKPEFLKKLTNDVYIEEYDDDFEDDYIDDYEETPIREPIRKQQPIQKIQSTQRRPQPVHRIDPEPIETIPETSGSQAQEPSSKELSVDVYQNPEEIVIRAMIAGVPPHSVDIALTRDMLTISGSREEDKEVTEGDYFQRELYWGSFTRTVMLPAEIDVDQADAREKHGILTLRLPKINKDRQAKIKVKSR